MREFKLSKPTIFIGSSDISKAKAESARKIFSKTGDVTVWNKDFFDLNESYLQSLLNYIGLFDYAILIMSPDDTLIKEQAVHTVARDNVIFELGLCLGRLGKHSTFALCEQTVTVPSDLSGIHLAQYKDRDKKSFPAACKLIEQQLTGKKKINFNLSPAGVIANFYAVNFLLPTLRLLLLKRECVIVSSKGTLSNSDIESLEFNIILFDQLDKFDYEMANMVMKKENVERVFIQGQKSRTVQVWADMSRFASQGKLVIYDIPVTLQLLKNGLTADIVSPDFIPNEALTQLYERSQIMEFVKTLQYRVTKQFPRHDSPVRFLQGESAF
jgi:hypothetical protein